MREKIMKTKRENIEREEQKKNNEENEIFFLFWKFNKEKNLLEKCTQFSLEDFNVYSSYDILSIVQKLVLVGN